MLKEKPQKITLCEILFIFIFQIILKYSLALSMVFPEGVLIKVRGGPTISCKEIIENDSDETDSLTLASTS